MKNLFLSIVVVGVLVAAGIGGTFAGFVDTEVVEDNLLQAGISDLLVNGKNDPIVGDSFSETHVVPGISRDYYYRLMNWGVCEGGDAYMQFKAVLSVEAGTKPHGNPVVQYIYDGVAPATGLHPFGYREAAGIEPDDTGSSPATLTFSSEPEKIAEVGAGLIGEVMILASHPDVKGNDYASGISVNLEVSVEVPIRGVDGYLGNPDTNSNNKVDGTEYADWITAAAGNSWVNIASLTGTLDTIAYAKDLLGFLKTQETTFVHVTMTLPQLYACEWYDDDGDLWGSQDYNDTNGGVDYDLDGDVDGDDFQKAVWPTNALQGDKATWDVMFELLTEPPST